MKYLEEKKKWNFYKKQIAYNRLFILVHGKKKFVMKKYQDNGFPKFDFENPITFNEKLQVRKLKENRLRSICADKDKVRKYVTEKIGEKYLIPQFFCKKKICVNDLEKLPNSFILKTSNGSGTNKIVFDKKKENLNELCKLLNYYTSIKYGYIWGEFYYNKIPIRIVAEKLLMDKNKNIPNDLKIHCFNDGKKKRKFIESYYKKEEKIYKNIYDENWNPINYVFGFESDGRILKKPKNLKEILTVSDKLSEEFNYVRVDLYNLNEKIYFGELTFIPGAGYAKFNPCDASKIWGEFMGKEKDL